MSIILTRTQNIRPAGNLDKNEIRGSRYGVLDAFVKDVDSPNGIVTSDLSSKYFSSIGSTVETPVIDYDGGISIGSTRSHTVSAYENTSAMQTITSSTYAWGFTMVPTNYHNNEIGYKKDFEKKFWAHAYLFLATIDSALATILNTNRTQVFTNALSYGDPTVGDIVLVDLAKELRVLREVQTMMEANDYFNALRIIGNGGLQSIVDRTQNYGKFNEENKALSLSDKTFHYSNRVSDAVGHGATFYAVEEGNLGIMSRVDREALVRGRSPHNGYEWDVINFPILGLPVGTMYYETVGDQSGSAGAATADNKAARLEHYAFSVDIAAFTNYNSAIATRANPIMKFGVLAT